MIRDFPVRDSPTLREQADAWQRDRTRAATPRPAATVMFVRDAPAGVEVFMLRRVASMAFAPRMMAFPGGGVDVRDADPRLPWAGPSPREWAGRLNTDEATARELVAAAVREVFEECGVLLAGPSAESVIADVSSAAWHEQRQLLLDRSRSLSEVLIAHELVLRSDLLAYRSHWITPEFEPRRYDTRFFTAQVPAGQRADDRSTEADVAGWMLALDVLRARERGEAMMLPPTLVSVEEIAAAESASVFLAEQPPVAPVMPVLTQTDDGLVLRTELPR